MAGLGLGAYSSSDSEEDGAAADTQEAQHSEEARPSGTHAAQLVDTPVGIPGRSNEAGVNQMNSFDRGSRKRFRHRKGGLPLFSRPLDATGDSDSDEEDHKAAKRRIAANTTAGSLSFLPQPQNPIPVRDEPAAEPSNVPTTSTIELFPTAETAEMYRLQDSGEAASETAAFGLSTEAVRPAELLAQSMQAGQHVEFKEINADELQRAAPHEQSEIEALRIAMGSDHAKELQQATTSSSGPSKRQRQRHQINSLYHHAKATELQDMQRKQSNNRSKAVTHAKYGW